MILSCQNTNKQGFCLQKETRNSPEQRTVRFSSIQYDYQELGISELRFSNSDAIPIGSVEFVQEFARIHGIPVPTFDISYPQVLWRYLKRTIRLGYFIDASPNEFVKPRETKLFTGGIRAQLEEIPNNPHISCWISEPIDLKHEFRFYILNREVVGWAQYDDHREDGIPNIGFVKNIIYDFGDSQPAGYAIDLGETSSGEFVLIEINDGWALGFYQWGHIFPENYVKLLVSRWEEIRS
jgi:hypothetical protein